MLPGGSAAGGPRTTLLVALLAATLFFASLLAYEALDAARAERTTAERALRDHASVAAWELRSAARDQVDGALGRVFGSVTGAASASTYEPLPALPARRASVPAPLACGEAPDAVWRTDFRLDLRTSEFLAEGAPRSRSETRALTDAAQRFVREGATPERPLGTARVMLADGEVPVALGVRYARLGGPVAIYGMTLCPSALGGAFFRDLVARHPLAPLAAAGRPNDSLFVVTILSARGDTVFDTGQGDASSFAGEGDLSGWDGWRYRVAVRTAAAQGLLTGGRGPARVPLLIALLAVSATLGVVALLQLRREHELARLRADFIAGVSHELRTPLAQILLFGETLALGRARSEAERRLATDTILHEARRLMHMVDNVLLFGRDRRSGDADTPVPVALKPVIDAVIAGFEPLARPAGTRIEACVPDELTVLATGGGVRQILLNLVDNALKYGPPRQTIRVEAVPEGEAVIVAVDDEGPGIPPSDEDRIWRPWVRLRQPRGSASGSGIGLSVVRELAESFGGAASVERSTRGGARFMVRLPAVPVNEPAGIPA